RHTVRLVAFSTEEPPFTRTRKMGSLLHARLCRKEKRRVVAMMSLETLGRAGTRGLFGRPRALLVVGNLRSRALVRGLQLSHGRTRAVVAPGFLPGVKSSDHWSFWKQRYPAVMVTDGGPLRYRHYHRASDTPDRLDEAALARTEAAIFEMAERLCGTRLLPAPLLTNDAPLGTRVRGFAEVHAQQ
ncbi:MAG: M28 family peptidase, partial [Myxococcales bacterium]